MSEDCRIITRSIVADHLPNIPWKKTHLKSFVQESDYQILKKCHEEEKQPNPQFKTYSTNTFSN